MRIKNVRLKHIRGARDESEVVVRLADRWAGCLRAFLNGDLRFSQVINEAINKGLLKQN